MPREISRDVRFEARRHERQSCRPVRIDSFQNDQTPPHEVRAMGSGDPSGEFTFGPYHIAR